MIVMKFGGTSIEDTPSIKRVTEIVLGRVDSKPLVVLSAMGKTTRKLLSMAELSARGMEKEFLDELNNIRSFHYELAKTLLTNFNNSEAYARLEKYFEEIEQLLRSLCTLRELTPKAQDHILSYGELLSTAIAADFFKQSGIKSVLFDSRNLVITDNTFTRAYPIEELTFKAISDSILPAIESGRVPVVQGFIGSTRDGETTTLGFEGSDFTAALFGAALNASDIEIWKDVSGIMTADPSIYKDARTVKLLSFEEASELTFWGAKVLHPSTIEPAQKRGITIHVYNSKNKEKSGTVITNETGSSTNLIKSITYKRNVSILSLSLSPSISSRTFFESLFEIFDRQNLMPYLAAAIGLNISFAFPSSANYDILTKELASFGKVSVTRNKATISLVGENLRTVQNFVGTVFQALGEIKVEMFSHLNSLINFTFVIDETELVPAIAKLHEFFFSELDPEIFQ